MDTPNQPQPAGKSHTIYWVILVVVILGIAAGLYYALRTTEATTNTNSVSNTNVALNSNATGNVNTNAATNSNASTNTNASSNANTTLDTSDWHTYTNSEYGYTAKYPADWTVSEAISRNADPLNRPLPVRSVTFSSPDNEYVLVLGIQSVDDTGALNLGGGIGAGDTTSDGTISILGTDVTRTINVYQGRVKHYFYPAPGQTLTIRGYSVGAQFHTGSGNTLSYNDVTLAELGATTQAEAILQSLSL